MGRALGVILYVGKSNSNKKIYKKKILSPKIRLCKSSKFVLSQICFGWLNTFAFLFSLVSTGQIRFRTLLSGWKGVALAPSPSGGLRWISCFRLSLLFHKGAGAVGLGDLMVAAVPCPQPAPEDGDGRAFFDVPPPSSLWEPGGVPGGTACKKVGASSLWLYIKSLSISSFISLPVWRAPGASVLSKQMLGSCVPLQPHSYLQISGHLPETVLWWLR